MNKQIKPIVTWLYSVAALVFIMVIVGAITRLTNSGLSMVEWRPLLGTLPPMNEAEWNRVYELYKQSPEFIKENSWMALEDFKGIFFWEWAHRVLGRLIGLAYGVPLLIFWLRGMIPSGYKLKLLGMFFLGGAQGLMGWYMVQSGLVDMPAVSHFRLAAHLGLAFTIFSLLIWLARDIAGHKSEPHKPLFIQGIFAMVFLAITITWGAFVAGLDAGLLYNEHFPMMTDGQWGPDTWAIAHEHSAVQFTHRWLAIFTTLFILGWWGHSHLIGRTYNTLNWLAVAITAQATLGVATLLSGVETHIATAHQAGALINLYLIIVTIHQLRPRRS